MVEPADSTPLARRWPWRVLAAFVTGTLVALVLIPLLVQRQVDRLREIVTAGEPARTIVRQWEFELVQQYVILTELAISDDSTLIAAYNDARWLLLAVVYDGMVLLVATAFGSYAVEPALLALMIANPLDLARMLLLMSFDAGALMGYTGAVFQRFFGSAAGAAISSAALLLWIGAPFAIGLRMFGRRDF